MNKIQRLLQEHCPNGVEWKTLGEVFETRNGYTPSKANAEFWTNGTIPWFRMEDIRANGGVLKESIQYITTQAVKGKGLFEAGSIIMATTATIGEHALIIADSLANQRFTNFKVRKSLNKRLLSKFIYYYFFIIDEWCKRNVNVSNFPSVEMERLKRQQFPLPPLPVQQEIVRILDKFTTLEAELEAELEARKKQYEYYRDNLFTFGDEVEWKPLGEVGTFVRGNGLQKKDLTTSGIPAIHYGQIYTYYGVSVEQTISFVTPETAKGLKKVDYGDVIITNTSENLEDVGKAVFYSVKEQGVIGGHATIFQPSKEIIGKYLVYYTQTAEFSNQKRKYAKGTKVIDVSANDLAKIMIPIPYPNDTEKSLEEQARIVAILDKFDTLVNSISEGLPKEIALRRKQYEYYREQLLSFPKR